MALCDRPTWDGRRTGCVRAGGVGPLRAARLARSVLEPEDCRGALAAKDDHVAGDREEAPEPDLARTEADDRRPPARRRPVDRLLEVVSRGQPDGAPSRCTVSLQESRADSGPRARLGAQVGGQWGLCGHTRAHRPA